MMLWLELVLLLAVPFVAVLFVLGLRKVPRKLKVRKYVNDWKQLQVFCKDKTTWPKALLDADKLLDQALKRRKYKGKSMGERLVSAQRRFTDNDGVWSAHNLTKKITASPEVRLRESMVKAALIAYRQALQDIGALPNGR